MATQEGNVLNDKPRENGHLPFYDTPEDLQIAIDDYFKNGVTKRTVIVGRKENQQAIVVPVPTISGLCYHLGFASRQSFYDYEEKANFTYTVKRARLFIEKEYEEQLQTGNTVGAIFALKNMGWLDRQDHELTGREGGPIAVDMFEKALKKAYGSS
jgi:hypothetical protein